MMKDALLILWTENKRIILFLFLMIVFRSSFADWNTVPTGSMKPTILEGDRVWINKLAYDVKVPFTSISLYPISDPQRGEIVVFDSKRAEKRLVKRVIGLPGDRIELKNKQLYINNAPATYSLINRSGDRFQFLEEIADINHNIILHNGRFGRLDSFGPTIVPPDQYLVLGDNRDNSADSRVYGFVPRQEIVGRTTKVVISLNYEKYYLPRSDRFFRSLYLSES